MTLAQYGLAALLMGTGATLIIDLWAWLLNRVFGIGSLNFCLLGRWLAYMPHGQFYHRSIAARSAARSECALGWAAHYSIGVVFAAVFLGLAPPTWLMQPTLAWSLGFGLATVLLPFCLMQPCLGMGLAASKTAKPGQARAKSLATHALFGVGLYFCAGLLAPLMATIS